MLQAARWHVQRQERPMAFLGSFPVEFGAVFPSGAFAAGGVEKVRDFDKSSGDRMVQQTDKVSGLPLWVVEVIDADPQAGAWRAPTPTGASLARSCRTSPARR
jgi:hypothetical protein